MRLGRPRVAGHRGDPPPDGRRGVRHRPDHRRFRPKNAPHSLRSSSPPRSTGTASRRRPSPRSTGSAAPIICGLTAISTTAGDAGRSAFRCTPVPLHPVRRVRLDHPDRRRRQTLLQPALQHGRPHLAAAQKHQPPGLDRIHVHETLRASEGKVMRARRPRQWRPASPFPGCRRPRRPAGTPDRTAPTADTAWPISRSICSGLAVCPPVSTRP